MKKALGWALLPVMFLALSTLAQANDWSKVRVYRAGYEQGYRDGMVRGYGTATAASAAENTTTAKTPATPNGWGIRENTRKAIARDSRPLTTIMVTADSHVAIRDTPAGYPGGYLSNGYWGGSDYRDYGRGRYDHDLAYERSMDRGYLKGLEKGREDFRKHRDYDPARHKQYRNADDGYKSSYGDRRHYEADYRRAFEDGYRQAYRP